MDNFSFWLYLAFGAIYLISRVMKSKKPQQTPPRQQRPASRPGQNPTSRPMTFEELLKEFTEGRTESEKTVKEEVRSIEKEQSVEATKLIRERERQQEDFSREGNNRQYSSLDDEEARRVYEESIRKAEGAALEFERDEHFTQRVGSRNRLTEDQPSFAAEISEMLKSKDGAKKAVILSEILNRKY